MRSTMKIFLITIIGISGAIHSVQIESENGAENENSGPTIEKYVAEICHNLLDALKANVTELKNERLAEKFDSLMILNPDISAITYNCTVNMPDLEFHNLLHPFRNTSISLPSNNLQELSYALHFIDLAEVENLMEKKDLPLISALNLTGDYSDGIFWRGNDQDLVFNPRSEDLETAATGYENTGWILRARILGDIQDTKIV